MTSPSTLNTISGRSAFIELLQSEGVTHLFGNPGTTELPIMHALADYPDMRYVLGLQEAIVVAMADGYARASGELVACNVHVAPGLGNAMGSLFTAFNSGTPLIITAGQQEQGHGLTEPLLYAPLVPIATPVVKWATEVTRLEDLPRIVHRAAKIAATPPTGPVFISLPGDILNAFGAIDLGQATRVDTRVRPSDESLRALAERLLRAGRPVIIAGHEIIRSDALAEAARFAEVLGCPVYDQTVLQGAHFPTHHPTYLGPLSRDQKTVRARLEPYDTAISLGSDFLRMSVYSEVEPLPPHMAVIQIGLNDWEMGKTYPAEIAIRSDVKETLRVLTPLVAELGGAKLRQRAAEALGALSGRNWTASRKTRAEAAMAKASSRRMDSEWLMLTITDLLPQDAIIVDEALTTAASLPAYMHARSTCLFRQCQRRYRLGHRCCGGHPARPTGAQGRGPARRRQCHVFDPGAMDRREIADNVRDLQQWRLPHHQTAPEAVPQHRPLYRDGFRQPAHRVRRARAQPRHAGLSRRNPR